MNNTAKSYDQKNIWDLIEHFDIQEAELKDIDIDLIFSSTKITVSGEFKTKEDVIYFLNNVQRDYDKEQYLEENSKEYLFLAEEYTGDYPNIETIKYLMVEMEETDDMRAVVSILIDFENGIAYQGTGQSITRDYIEMKGYSLSEDEKQLVIQTLKDSDTSKWEQDYCKFKLGNNYYWKVGLEFTDGTVISYKGYQADNCQPEEFSQLYSTVLRLK